MPDPCEFGRSTASIGVVREGVCEGGLEPPPTIVDTALDRAQTVPARCMSCRIVPLVSSRGEFLRPALVEPVTWNRRPLEVAGRDGSRTTPS
jgi:hypothetical protein